MQIILKISSQPATQNKERQASVLQCHKDGSLLMDARDGEKPPRFTLTKEDVFPWEEFLGKLLIAWQLGDYSDVPPQFRPQKRIPQFVLDGFTSEPLPSKLKILATLRQQGYFTVLANRK